MKAHVLLLAITFFSYPILAGASPPKAEAECRAVVASKICPVSGFNDYDDYANAKRSCESANAPVLYESAIEEMYDLAPLFIKKVLCGLDKIFIEQGTEFTYDAWSVRSGGSDYIGFRASIISNRIDFKTYFASYDQHFFKGGVKDVVQLDLPHITTNFSTGIDSTGGALMALASHEAGHLILYRSPSVLEPWTSLAWQQNAKGEFEIVDRNVRDFGARFCFPSSCSDHEKVDRALAEPGYSILTASSFPTFFSMIDPIEDFCESVMFYSLSKSATAIPFSLPTSGKIIDVLERVKNPSGTEFERKHAYLEEVERQVIANW